MCSCERISDTEQSVNNYEETVIKRYETLDFQILVSILIAVTIRILDSNLRFANTAQTTDNL